MSQATTNLHPASNGAARILWRVFKAGLGRGGWILFCLWALFWFAP